MNIYLIIDWADSILFFLLFLEVAYLLLLGSVTRSVVPPCRIDKLHKYAVLIPTSFTLPAQDYSSDYYQVVYYDNWRKQIKELAAEAFDYAIILGPFVSIPPHLLSTINNAHNSGFKVLQLHTILDRNKSYRLRRRARFEELRNGLFKSGRCGIGLSAALDKYNFVIPLEWVQQYMKTERTNLEWALISRHLFIKYLSEPYIVAKTFPSHFKARSVGKSIKRLFKFLTSGNTEEIERDIMRLFPTTSWLVAIIAVMGIALIFVDYTWSIKWWILLFFTFFSFSLAMPDYVMEPHKKHKTLNLYKIWKNRQSKSVSNV